MPTCCPISSAPKPGRAARTLARRLGPARHRIRQDARSAVRCLDRGRQGGGLPHDRRTTTAKQQEGFGRGQYTIRDGRRSSSARAYLRPARNRRQSHGRDRRACDAGADAGHARDRRRIRQGQRRPQSAPRRPRCHPRERRVQLTAASDAVRHRPGRASARDGHRDLSPTCRWARTCRIISAPT